MRSLKTPFLIATASVLLCIGVSVSSANASQPKSSPAVSSISGPIRNGYNYCLGVNKSKIVNVKCVENKNSWTVTKSSRSAGYTIGNKKCVTAVFLKNGQNLTTENCGSFPAAHQDWVALPSGGIALVGSNFCLDVEVGVPKLNSPIQIYTCLGLIVGNIRVPAQRWVYGAAMFNQSQAVTPVVTIARPNRDLFPGLPAPPTTTASAANPTAPKAPTSFSVKPGLVSHDLVGNGLLGVFWSAEWNASPGATRYELEVSRLKNPLTGQPRGTKPHWDVQYISTTYTRYTESSQEFKYQDHAVLRVGIRACNSSCSRFVYSETDKRVPYRARQRELLMSIANVMTVSTWSRITTLRSESGKRLYFPYSDWSNDGCSNSPDRPLANFILACSLHDWLYRNSKRIDKETTGDEYADRLWNAKNRKIFDDQLLFLLRQECVNKVGSSKVSCQALARIYYFFVREHIDD